MNNIIANIVSSLEKCRFKSSPLDYPRLEKLSGLRGEHLNFQFVISLTGAGDWDRKMYVSVESPLTEVRLRQVKYIHTDFSTYPSDPTVGTEKFLNYGENTYPDILAPVAKFGVCRPTNGCITAFWADITVPENADAGDYPVTFTVSSDTYGTETQTVTLEVIGATLPAPDYTCTLWFHCDCLASRYGVPVFSEEHWRLIGNFMRAAVAEGQTMVLTPVITPPLDTGVGGERPTVQLVDVTATEKGNIRKYSFGFEKLDRYITLALECGFTYLEMPPLFSQWGAKYAPKVIATLNGEEKRIFGWDTPGTEGEYPVFMDAFLPSLAEHLRTLSVYDKCVFHISDEPSPNHIPGYKKAKEIIMKHLAGSRIIDALSDIRFVEQGVCCIPVPANNCMDDFIRADLSERWTYYCCGQTQGVSNRFVAYPSWRNRILGTQMYKFNITGFLQWGYNFYYDQQSCNLIDPYTDQTGGGWVPAGDTFMVYPGADGTPDESLRFAVFGEALTDLRALKLCEKLCGRKKVLELIDAEMPVTFTDYPCRADYILNLRAKVNELIKAAVAR